MYVCSVQKFLVIQTAFIGDVVLATGIIEKLHTHFPGAQIDFLLRKGNEALLAGHPFLHEVLVWDKKKHKLRNLWTMWRRIRATKYDKVINVQRFAATGLLTAFSGGAETIGFDKNPLSWLFSKKIKHVVSYQPGKQQTPGPVHNATPDPGHRAAGPMLVPAHEIDRNQLLIKDFTDPVPARPRLYPSQKDEETVREYKKTPYITIGPASVWFTKQYPAEKWASFIARVPAGLTIYLLGAPSDNELAENIRQTALRNPTPSAHPSPPAPIPGPTNAASPHNPAHPDPTPANAASPQSLPPRAITNLSGKLTFLQSVALMKDAAMNYTNDSAPMHFASAGNAPVTAVYCSTIPAFGFGPLSDKKFIVEIQEPLGCRPCGLHGYKACPLGHFRCAHDITDEQLLATLP